jgi:hypothetical protein
MSIEMKVELTDHVGKSRSGADVDHNQWIVMIDDQHIGYLGKEPGSVLGCFVPMDQATRDKVVEAINQKLPNHAGGIVTPPDFDDDDEDLGEIEEWQH